MTHAISTIALDGVSASSGLAFAVGAQTVDLTYIDGTSNITFYLTSTSGTMTHTSPQVTLTLTCDSSGTLTTTIMPALLMTSIELDQDISYGNYFNFTAAEFTYTYAICNKNVTFTVTSDAAGLVKDTKYVVVWDADAQMYMVEIDTATVGYQYFYVRATNENGNYNVSAMVTVNILEVEEKITFTFPIFADTIET